jgi:hypothetical protein
LVPSSPSAPHFCDQLAVERPVLLLEPFDDGQHFAVDELGRRLADEPVLLGQLLGRHHR